MQNEETTEKKFNSAGNTFAPQGFRRGKAVKKPFIGAEVGEPIFCKIMSVSKEMTTKLGDTYTYREVIDLSTGEEVNMWCSGGLEYQVSELEIGTPVEINLTGKALALVTIEGKPQEREVNQYTVHLLETDLDATERWPNGPDAKAGKSKKK